MIKTLLLVVRVNPLHPPPPQFLLHRPAPEVQPTLVEEGGALIGTGHRDHHRSIVRHIPEPLLAFAQCLFGPLALGHLFWQSLNGALTVFQQLRTAWMPPFIQRALQSALSVAIGELSNGLRRQRNHAGDLWRRHSFN